MLRTGLQNEAFTVLRRGHQASIDGHIRVDLDACDSQSESLKQLWADALDLPVVLYARYIITNQTGGRGNDALSNTYTWKSAAVHHD